MHLARILFLLPLAALTACYGPEKSPQEVALGLNRTFVNRPANEFFFSYGQPVGEFSFDSGARVYRWASTQPARVMGEFPAVTYTSPDGSYRVTDNYDGTLETHYCELRVYTDANDIIQRFAIAVDSMGKWSASRCSEIFGSPSLDSRFHLSNPLTH